MKNKIIIIALILLILIPVLFAIISINGRQKIIINSKFSKESAAYGDEYYFTNDNEYFCKVSKKDYYGLEIGQEVTCYDILSKEQVKQ